MKYTCPRYGLVPLVGYIHAFPNVPPYLCSPKPGKQRIQVAVQVGQADGSSLAYIDTVIRSG